MNKQLTIPGTSCSELSAKIINQIKLNCIENGYIQQQERTKTLIHGKRDSVYTISVRDALHEAKGKTKN